MSKVKFPSKPIKTKGVYANGREGLRWEIAPEEQQVRDNRGGPKLNPPRKKEKPGGEQTSWLK